MDEKRIKINKKLLLAAVLFAALIFISAAMFGFKKETHSGTISLKINNIGIEAELADTVEKRTAGLSGRLKLGENQGMFFIFDAPDYHSFWMKDMKFPIDIIWISEGRKITDIAKNAAPESYPETFTPSQPVKYVLEVNAGFTNSHQIKTGNYVQ